MTNKKITIPNKRHTHSTNAGLEDANAILSRLLLETIYFLRYLIGHLRRVRKIIKTVRQNPNAYDPDQASGSKIKSRTK